MSFNDVEGTVHNNCPMLPLFVGFVDLLLPVPVPEAFAKVRFTHLLHLYHRAKGVTWPFYSNSCGTTSMTMVKEVMEEVKEAEVKETSLLPTLPHVFWLEEVRVKRKKKIFLPVEKAIHEKRRSLGKHYFALPSNFWRSKRKKLFLRSLRSWDLFW